MISANIEKLLSYGQDNGLLSQHDVIVARNALLDLFRLTMPHEQAISNDASSISALLAPMLDYAVETGLIANDTIDERDLFVAKIMGLLTPRAGEVVERFYSRLRHDAALATDWFYQFSKATNYIQTERIAKNHCWTADTDFGNVEMTVNLTKPEKTTAEVMAAAKAPASGYPKCLLCAENAGYVGNLRHPGRQNHRIIPIELCDELWYFQFSPYSYYNEHCIVLSEQHVPMNVNALTFKRLLDFVQQFPHYFLGSNAGLPIVGGSILSHEHYQGGRHTFAIDNAEILAEYTHPDYEGLMLELVKWPTSAVRLRCESPQTLAAACGAMLAIWEQYDDEERDIVSFMGDAPHNTVTPIARKRHGTYEMTIALRNNRTTEQYPMGIFHPHEQWHHIKKENIGLIEVMGLAVLPPRLMREYPDDVALHAEADRVFVEVLKDTGVFKQTSHGLEGFAKFLDVCGYSKS
ncbi:MAG: UDP-glucose--hexose-1-phosphate uridylyltransferase [Oscillospiraceae bacterium]|nr:UDP-glucose--hexose-1-phosphate uridylyltransferase [Oscillospiraceae bacterium]